MVKEAFKATPKGNVSGINVQTVKYKFVSEHGAMPTYS